MSACTVCALQVHLSVPSLYAPLRVALPVAVDEGSYRAKFHRRERRLTLVLPKVANACASPSASGGDTGTVV